MNLHKLYFFFTLFCISNMLLSQSFTYEYRYKLDSTNLSSVSQDILNLEINSTNSIFYSINRYHRNQFKNTFQPSIENGAINMRNLPKAGVKWSIKTDINTKNLIVYEDYTMFRFQYEDEVNLDWTLHDETKTYDHLKVQKATTSFRGRKYIAWYSTDIPMAFGPYKFHGLPGLIVEIYDDKKHHHFKLIEDNYIDLPNDYFEDFKQITKSEFHEFKARYESDPKSLIDPSLGLSTPPEYEHMYRERIEIRKARRNNFIEFK